MRMMRLHDVYVFEKLDIETDTDHNCYLMTGVNNHFARVKRFIRLDYEFEIESDSLFVLNGYW